MWEVNFFQQSSSTVRLFSQGDRSEESKIISIADFIFYTEWTGFILRKGGLAPMTDTIAAFFVYLAMLLLSIPQSSRGTWIWLWDPSGITLRGEIRNDFAEICTNAPLSTTNHHGLIFLLLVTLILLVPFLNIFTKGTLTNLFRWADFLSRNFK